MQSPKVLYNSAPNLISTSLYITFGEEEGVWWGERAAWVSKCPCNRAGWAQPLADTIAVPPYSARNTVTRQQASLSGPHLQATALSERLSVVRLSYWPAPQWALPTVEGPLRKWLRQGWVLWWLSGSEVRGRFRPSPRGPPAYPALSQQVSWKAQEQAGDYVLQDSGALTKALH